MPHFHDPVAKCREGDEERPRKPCQRRVRALDEDAVVIGGRCGSGEIEPGGRCARPGDQPRPAAFEWLEDVFPGDRVAAVAVGNRQHEIARRVDGGHHECIRRTGNRGHDVAAGNRLESGLDRR